MFFFVTPREVDIAKDRILDASTMLPDHHGSCPRTSFLEARLPGALFWDVDSIADTSSEEGRLLPHMAPSLQTLRLALCRLGVKSTDRVVIYDQSNGLYCASFRLMWTLMLYSFPGEIRVLRGGLQAWKEASLELSSGEPSPPAAASPIEALSFRPELICTIADVKATLQSNTTQIVDVRSRGRFRGDATEPRENVVSGHMPGSMNLPFTEILEVLDDLPALQNMLEAAGVDIRRRLCFSCGSGMTACIGFAAALLLGLESAVFDASWLGYVLQDVGPVIRHTKSFSDRELRMINSISNSMDGGLEPRHQRENGV